MYLYSANPTRNNESANYLVMFSATICYWETYWKAECWENIPEEERDYNWWATYARELPTSQ